MVTELERRYHRPRASGHHPVSGLSQSAQTWASYSGGDCHPACERSGCRHISGERLSLQIRLWVESGNRKSPNNVGVFSRLGWNDGHEAGLDVQPMWTTRLHWASASKAKRGTGPTTHLVWRACSTAFPRRHQEFFAAGGTGILAGDGNLNYGWEKILETYYDFKIWKTIHAARGLPIHRQPGLQPGSRAGFRLRRAAALGILICHPRS